MKKVTLGLIVVLTVIVFLFPGCTRQGDDPNDVRLKVLYCWNIGFKVPSDQYNNAVAKIIREKTGVTVEVESIMMNEIEKLNLMFASGDMPDIVNAPFWGGNADTSGLIKKAGAEGRLLPIEDYLEKYPNIKRAYDLGVVSQVYLENDLDDPSFNGHRYLIPQQTFGNEDQITNWAYGIFVRADVPKALGIDERSIKTTEQLLDFMRKAGDYGFKDTNGNNAITASSFQNGWAYILYGEAFTDSQKMTNIIDNGDGTFSDELFTQRWVDKQLFIWRLVNEGLLDKECFRHSGTLAEQKIGNGTALFFAAQYSHGINATKQTGLYNAHPEMRYVPVGPLNDYNGLPLVQAETDGRTGSPAVFFPSTCKNIDAAMRFIDFINSPEGLLLTTYGIEGKTFVRNNEGQPRLTPELLERKARGDDTWMDILRDAGALYLADIFFYGDTRKTLFGEESPGAADAAVPELEEYKLMRPVKVFTGYPVSAFTTHFPDIDRVIALWSGDYERTYCERAYFASTEAEARQILRDYQNFVRTFDNGIYMKLLDFLAEKAQSRDDIIF